MKRLLIVSAVVFGASGFLMASQASPVTSPRGIALQEVEKLVDSYVRQGFEEVTHEQFDAKHLAQKAVIDKFLAGKMSTLIDSKLEEVRNNGDISWRQHQYIILKLQDGTNRFFVKTSMEKFNGNNNNH